MPETSGNIHEDGSLISGSYSTNEDRLRAVNDAIFKVLAGGQKYKLGSRELTRADLDVLIAERDKLEAALKSEARSMLFPGTFAADFGYDNRR